MESLFVDYLQDPQPLTDQMDAMLDRHQIHPLNGNAIHSFMAPLRSKGPAYLLQYEHSIRVALRGEKTAELMHLDPKVLIYAGLLHDIGKAQVPAHTLGKTSGWTDQDTKNMRPHVMDAYRLIRDRFDYTAEVILWHHRFQKNGYPVALPNALHEFCLGSKVMIPFYGRLLSLCDQFDAFHRINDKHGERQVPTGEGIKSLILAANPDQRALIADLYIAAVFTTYTAAVPQPAE